MYLFRIIRNDYILYSKGMKASHICLKTKHGLNRDTESKGNWENVDFDLYNACPSHVVYEHLKRSHSHHGDFRPDNFFETIMDCKFRQM